MKTYESCSQSESTLDPITIESNAEMESGYNVELNVATIAKTTDTSDWGTPVNNPEHATPYQAARRTLPPHMFQIDTNISRYFSGEIQVKTSGTVDTEPMTPIVDIFQVATDVLKSLEADLQDHGIDRPL